MKMTTRMNISHEDDAESLTEEEEIIDDEDEEYFSEDDAEEYDSEVPDFEEEFRVNRITVRSRMTERSRMMMTITWTSFRLRRLSAERRRRS